MSRFRYQRPKVIDGGFKPLPETRKAVLAKYLPLKTPSAIIRYSNGEFYSSSLIVAKTFLAIADRRLDMECAADIAYYDSVHKLWHRAGGSMD